ncbi:MAG TPA: hypothetical protein VK149_04875 [Sideroxyarcus sp.]|nr:hypothetical protein [Sideroxyarcus sp.]
MTTLTPEVVKKFCEHCDWAEQCWLLRKNLFDDNPAQQALFSPRHAHFFNRLALILQEHWLHEVAKLHDPARQSGRWNLSINYIFENGGWSSDVREKLERIKVQLSSLAGAIRVARNRLLSHHDLEIILSGELLGEFEEGSDIAYFEALREYASTVHEAVLGEPFLFEGLTRNDVEAFISQFQRGAA